MINLKKFSGKPQQDLPKVVGGNSGGETPKTKTVKLGKPPEESNAKQPMSDTTKKLMAIGCIVLFIIIIILLVLSFTGGKEEVQTQPQQISPEQQKQEQEEKLKEQGEKTLTSGQADVDNTAEGALPDTPQYSEEDLKNRISDLEKNNLVLQEQIVKMRAGSIKNALTSPKVPPFKANEILQQKVFLSYTKYYTTSQSGVYSFWLEADYHGKNYQVGVPFDIYRQLEPNGIVLAEMETVMTPKGEKIITGFRINEDFHEPLEQ